MQVRVLVVDTPPSAVVPRELLWPGAEPAFTVCKRLAPFLDAAFEVGDMELCLDDSDAWRRLQSHETPQSLGLAPSTVRTRSLAWAL